MEFALKNIKFAAFASEETNCYKATLYIDGKRFAEVSNDGHGGCDRVYPFEGGWQAVNPIEEYCASLPKIVTKIPNEDGSMWEMKQSLETVCNDLLEAFLLERDVKKALKRRIMFTKPNEKGIYELSAKVKPTKEMIERYHAEKPEYCILNTLPLAEVVEIWKAA